MKKFTSVLLALAMTFSLCVSVSAARDGNGTGSEEIPVQINVEEGTGGTKYHVTVAWESMNFTYKKAATGIWNPDTHTYSDGNAAGWLINGNQLIAEVDGDGNYTAVSSAITVSNHSNAEVTVGAALDDDKTTETHDGVTLTLSTDAVDATLSDASQVAYADFSGADKIVYTLKVSGVPGNTYGANLTEIDTITVTINP